MAGFESLTCRLDHQLTYWARQMQVTNLKAKVIRSGKSQQGQSG